MNRIGLSSEVTKDIAEHLDQYLAELHVLYAKLHNYHWNVEGRGFFTIHAKLEELYDAVAEKIDEVAERILMVGHRPSVSLAAYLKKASLKEVESVPISSKEIAVDLLADYTSLSAALRASIVTAQEGNDEVSADLMIGSLAEYEKTMWMLAAFLK